MRHENQPSLTGLVFLAHGTQHWFGAVPLFSSCTACMRRTVLGYDQVVPAELCATNSCRSSGAGEECTSYRTAVGAILRGFQWSLRNWLVSNCLPRTASWARRF